MQQSLHLLDALGGSVIEEATFLQQWSMLSCGSPWRWMLALLLRPSISATMQHVMLHATLEDSSAGMPISPALSFTAALPDAHCTNKS